MIHRNFTSIFVILLFITLSTTLYTTAESSSSPLEVNGKVLELDESNIEAAIFQFDYIFINFCASWCSHCTSLAPELDKAAPFLAGLKKPIIIAKVDVEKHKKLCCKYDFDGYPTLFVHGVSTKYYGPTKAELLVQNLKKFVAPDVTILNADSAVNEFVKESGTDFPIFLGFGVDESLIKNLGFKYKKKAWFSVVKDFSEDLMSDYDIYKAPAFVAIHPQYHEKSVFYGPFEETFIEEYIKQNLLPLVLPINQDSLELLKELLKDDKRKIVLTIVQDETEEKTLTLVKLLKAGASANRDLVFCYVGLNQFEKFAESFDVDKKKTQLPKMVVWDGNQEYFTVIGSERLTEVDQGSEITRFIEGYKTGNVIKKQLSSPSLGGFIGFMMIVIYSIRIIFLIFLVVVIIIPIMLYILYILLKEMLLAGRENLRLRLESENVKTSGDKKQN